MQIDNRRQACVRSLEYPKPVEYSRGGAVACGYHLATGGSAVVYMQNSGLGNAINPLTSIAATEVYQVPMLLVVGWRGEPGRPDEPQHVKQGAITPQQLELLGIPYQVTDAGSDPHAIAAWVRQQLDDRNSPVALLVTAGTFDPSQGKTGESPGFLLGREAALAALLDLAGDAAIISTTGKTSREVFELRVARGEHQRDFLTVGGMGHTSSIALGVAIGLPNRKVLCLDGDGSTLMHMGALPIIGDMQPANFVHVLLNNAAHESVGGQPTVAGTVDFRAIALACGYRDYHAAATVDELADAWRRIDAAPGPVMLEIKISTGSRSDLGRPTSTPVQNKRAFMEWTS